MQTEKTVGYKGVLQTLSVQMQAHLAHFFEYLDLEEVLSVLEHILACKGTIFLIGVGKSGIIAKKVASTMSSCGVRALYLSPLDAPHGDLGIVQEGDAVICFSKSGETDELLHLCPALKNKGASIIAVVSKATSRLAQYADMAVTVPVARELCPFDLAPTTSTVAQLIFGDMLAMALMRIKKVSLGEYAKNHPAGQIGKRVTFRVQDVMLRGDMVPVCSPDSTIIDALVPLSSKRCGCVLVAEEKVLVGIFTDGDLGRSLQECGPEVLSKPISERMTKNPRSIGPEVLAYDAMKIMEERPNAAITVLPVVENGCIVGLVKLHDILQSGI